MENKERLQVAVLELLKWFAQRHTEIGIGTRIASISRS
jgi:hypothetical protein